MRIVVTLPGRTVEAASWEEFEGSIDTRDLQDILGLKIDIGEVLGPRGSMHFENKSPALSIEAVGDDRVRVDGMFQALVRALSDGSQLTQGIVGFLGAMILLVVVLAQVVLFAFLGVITYGTSSPASGGSDQLSSAFFVLLLVASVFVTLSATARLFPALEILPAGRTVAFVRFRVRIVGAIALIAAVVTIGVFLYQQVKP